MPVCGQVFHNMLFAFCSFFIIHFQKISMSSQAKQSVYFVPEFMVENSL